MLTERFRIAEAICVVPHESSYDGSLYYHHTQWLTMLRPGDRTFHRCTDCRAEIVGEVTATMLVPYWSRCPLCTGTLIAKLEPTEAEAAKAPTYKWKFDNAERQWRLTPR